jgi:hypothetical protein
MDGIAVTDRSDERTGVSSQFDIALADFYDVHFGSALICFHSVVDTIVGSIHSEKIKLNIGFGHQPEDDINIDRFL